MASAPRSGEQSGMLCRTPEHPIAEQVPFYITRSNEFRP
ncbi:hypothetical protein AK812_SmicGene47051, partial [Symbiodinium microadriaticum]